MLHEFHSSQLAIGNGSSARSDIKGRPELAGRFRQTDNPAPEEPQPEANPSRSLTVRTLTTPEEVERIRPVWSAFQKHPDADIDCFLLALRMRPEIVRPHVLVVYARDEPICLLAGHVEDGRLKANSGCRTFWRVRVRRLALSYAGLMGQIDRSTTDFIVSELLDSMREQKLDLLTCHDLRWESFFAKLLLTKPHPGRRDYLARAQPSWILLLPGSLEELLQKRMSKKRRYWARRIMRLLERDFRGALACVRYSTPEQTERLFQDAAVVAKQAYQWKLGVGFQNTLEQRERLKLEAHQGWLRAYVLYLQNQPAAFWTCTLYQERLYLGYTAYDPAFRQYELGTVLLLRIIEENCKMGVKSIRMGGGPYFYKRHLGNVQNWESTILVFAPTLRGVLLNVSRLITFGAIQLGGRAVKYCGFERQLKRLWRKCLQNDRI